MKANSIFIIILLSTVVGCSSVSEKSINNPVNEPVNKTINVSLMDYAGMIKLNSILIGSNNTTIMLEIIAGKKFMVFAPGTYNSFFFMDPITKKEYKLLSGEGIPFNADVNGPKKFSLTFERLDDAIKTIHLIGGKEAMVAGNKTVGFYDINLEK